MGLSISIFICTAVAVATIGALILETFQRHRTEHRTVEDSLNTMRRITEALSELPNLQGKERAAKRRAIAREILLDTGFVLSMVMQCWLDEPPKDQEVRERTWDVVDEIRQLNWEVRKSLFLFRFRPRLVADCQRTLHAVLGHYRVWIAYVRLLKAKYPERYGELSVPDLPLDQSL